MRPSRSVAPACLAPLPRSDIGWRSLNLVETPSLVDGEDIFQVVLPMRERRVSRSSHMKSAGVSGARAAFIDRALYLPQEWTDDGARRTEAGIPEETRFATKIESAQRMLERAFDNAVPARWVVADTFYGQSHALRQWLGERGRAYALMIPKTDAIRYRGRRERAEQLGE